MEFGKSYWRTFEQGIQREWVITNGIGGFASSTIIGANTRRYHGLLIASLHPPIKRYLILSKLDESIEVRNVKYDLFTNQTPDYISKGYFHLQRFMLDPFPTFLYNIQDVFIEKKVFMIYGQNMVVVLYKVFAGSSEVKLSITPIINFRDYHGDSSKEYMRFSKSIEDSEIIIKPYDTEVNIRIRISEGKFIDLNNWWFYNMYYIREQERGLRHIEDHFIPGYFEIRVNPYETKEITFICSLDKIDNLNGLELLEHEQKRIKKVIDTAGYNDDFLNKLVVAADSFIVYRKSTDSKTIIAGYPWFTDWGRDTMIALPGLTLVTKRFEDAKDILITFSKYIKEGLIPNMFPDEGQEPLYNTVDASLWYFEAVYKFLMYTKEYDFVKENLYSSLKHIIDKYVEGTYFNIKMDEDGLITAGEGNIQLTWMDAKVDDWVVTPRHGKPVEVNALWYNALRIMEYLARKFKQNYKVYHEAAEIVRKAFIKTFWNEKESCLYDVINKDGVDARIRPNQIFAVSLSFPVLEGDKAKSVVYKVWELLYTAYGLRTLSPYDKDYRGIYIGDRWSRDGAYHQGTVWSWLIGHFITGYRRVENYSEESRVVAKRLLEPFKDHLYDAGLGSISEIFDGDEPLIPRGCISQAWGVAEVLRAYVEEVLERKKK